MTVFFLKILKSLQTKFSAMSHLAEGPFVEDQLTLIHKQSTKFYFFKFEWKM